MTSFSLMIFGKSHEHQNYGFQQTSFTMGFTNPHCCQIASKSVHYETDHYLSMLPPSFFKIINLNMYIPISSYSNIRLTFAHCSLITKGS